jgi:TM2 domain-containing membrane protein YozV
LPNRFAPSLFWIVGSAFFLYIYFLVSNLLAAKLKKIELLEKPGKNVLFYLLVSNIFIFAIHSIYSNMSLEIVKVFILTGAILFAIDYLQDITRK